MLAAAFVLTDRSSVQQVQETNVMAKKEKEAAQAAGQPSASSEPTYPCKAEISHKEAAELAEIAAKDVFAVNEYADRYHVITVAGQRIEVKK
jgi:hypothetical protein